MDMTRRVVCAAAVMVTMAVAGGVSAQERAIQGSAALTMTAPLSGTADYFTPGFGGTAGVLWNLGEQYGVRADATWSTLTPKHSPFDVSGRVQFATADFFFQAPPGRARIYVLGGVGVYRRSATVAGAGPANTPVCVPWWFVCQSGTGVASAAAGTRSTTNVGVNVGFGVSSGRFFGELRFHYADGPTFATPTGDVPATGKFLPLTVGARF